MSKLGKGLIMLLSVSFLLVILFHVDTFAFKAREDLNAVEALEFQADNIYISSTQVPLVEIAAQLATASAWNAFTAQYDSIYVYFDPRSGRPDSLMYPSPLIPGDGEGNRVSLNTLANQLGYKVDTVTLDVIKDLLIQHLRKHNNLLNINLNELGNIRGMQVSPNLWNANFTRQINGIPVRDSNVSFTINHGNLVLWGFYRWGDINVNLVPSVSKDSAIAAAFNYISGKLPTDRFTTRPHLEILPLSPNSDRAVGKGYDHALVWVFQFQREGFNNNWEVMVDAHSGNVLSLQDTVQYVTKKIVGAIYPITNDECCPDGCAVSGAPAPYTNTGFAAPNDYTNWGGMYDYTSGTVVTSLDGRYINMGTDSCGTISESSATGDIDMGGTNGQHDCTIPAGHSAGDTFSSRSCAIEITGMNRQVKSWLPGMAWLDSFIICNVNQNLTCNATFSGNTINFYRSGGGCRNTGENAAVFDHEWGHAVDTHDAQPSISQPGEAIADIASSVRLHQSCIGRGFFWTLDRGCGTWTGCPTDPGTVYGYNCSGYNAAECCLGCTGIRQIDYVQHADPDADTPANYTCTICGAGSGTPCGKETHCEGIPPAEVGWDLAARDLQAAPFNLDKQTAFTVADKIIWQGHNNVIQWYTCTCPTTSGCAATNAYPGWLAADDDDGNVNNGTPHMTAIYAAHNRHAMACATPTPQNSGCSSGPSTAATLSATPGNNNVALSWTAVTGAANYYVWRTDGPYGCDFGRAKIATVATTSYTDNMALNGKTYYYNVQAVGSNEDCLGPLSNCVSAMPAPGPQASYQSNTFTDDCPAGGPGDGNGIIDPGETVVADITIINDGTGGITNINGTLSTVTPGVTMVDGSATFPNLPAPGNTASSNPPDYTYTVANSFTCGNDISFTHNLTYTEGAGGTSANFTRKVGQLGPPTVIFNQTWESGSTGWTMTGLWHLTTEAAQACMAEPYPSPVTVAYYGQDSTCTFNTGATTSGNLDRTTGISGITPDALLSFMYVYQGEGGTSYDRSSAHVSPDGTTWTQVWTDAGSAVLTWTSSGNLSLASWAGQSIRLRFSFNSVDGLYNDYLGFAVDNIQIQAASGYVCNTCTVTTQIPGSVLNNLTVAKSGANLSLAWTPPGGTCTVTGYGVYRGTLPIAAYTHSSLSCTASTPYSTPQDTGSYYFLVVPQNSTNEGSYGLDSSGAQIPAAATPCHPQNTSPC
ncbi:MAG: hypothetical protein A2Y62_14235 [Candidatus Fischerbacteria bacterium RBG_13_37_8]|uniref:Fibronectin type-III domain-containing protein n=1 Tax=Candidatus Fischerbacteria bacterium RBG_13_37_8 TaxID=1817863 RepID=A0A1F5VVG9_9BACT|nr:MAG: hypothetical protein A2Y62_14235 [Candidatus Fischerbacteria bacterium RBG_13_37_8]